jgi:hypothetical protein
MWMGTPLRVNGMMIKLTVTVFTLTLMEQNTKVTGKMIYSMARVKRSGLMVVGTKEITRKEKSMDKDFMCGLMAAHMKENG